MEHMKQKGQQLALFEGDRSGEERAEGEEGIPAELGAINELFRRSTLLRSTTAFRELIAFCGRFPHYSIFNCFLVFLQNPRASLFATATSWQKSCKRTVRPDARPMIILAPRSPVAFVYDVADTEGKVLPEQPQDPGAQPGFPPPLPPGVLQERFHSLQENGDRYRIHIRRRPRSVLHADGTTRRATEERGRYLLGNPKLIVEICDQLDLPAGYAALIHELAHIFLGHLGGDDDGWWPERAQLTRPQSELEAESVSYLVCRRAGLAHRTTGHLLPHLRDEHELDAIDLALLLRVASFLEKMGEKRLPEPGGDRS
ncbi:MAG: hypothetical protein FJ125_18075 [Deltaproteobacteria bacterium]|nr:hypothetical protein [Deltaproteobacteria bacterium]